MPSYIHKKHANKSFLKRCVCITTLVFCTSLTGLGSGDKNGFLSKFEVFFVFYCIDIPCGQFSTKGDIELAWQVQTRSKITNWSRINKVTANQKVLSLSLNVLAGSYDICSDSQELMEAAKSEEQIPDRQQIRRSKIK